jgi:hypothetical protein
MAGGAAFEAGDFAAAARNWRQLLAQMPEDTQERRDLALATRKAERRADASDPIPDITQRPAGPASDHGCRTESCRRCAALDYRPHEFPGERLHGLVAHATCMHNTIGRPRSNAGRGAARDVPD